MKNMVSNLLFDLYGRTTRKRFRNLILWCVSKLEQGPLYSTTLRRILSEYHKVTIGMYTMGGCFHVGQFGLYTTIGRYCSIAVTARAFNRNHPMNFKSTHAFFYNPDLGVCEKDTIEYNPLSIGHDVWIGERAMIMPHVNEIGHGAVLAAGSVVNKNVPPYAVVVGNPARIVRYRFSKEVIAKLLESRWWEQDLEALRENLDEYLSPLDPGLSDVDKD